MACSRCSHSRGLHGSREEDDLAGGFRVWSRTVFLCSCYLFPQSVGHAVAPRSLRDCESSGPASLPLDIICKNTEALFSTSVPTHFREPFLPSNVLGGPCFSVNGGQMASWV